MLILNNYEAKTTFLMLHRSILTVIKFQCPSLKRLGIVIKNIWGGGGRGAHHVPMSNSFNDFLDGFLKYTHLMRDTHDKGHHLNSAQASQGW